MTYKSSLKSLTLKTLSPIFLSHFSHFILSFPNLFLSFPHIFSQTILKMEKVQIVVAVLELTVAVLQLAFAALELTVAALELAIATLELTVAALQTAVHSASEAQIAAMLQIVVCSALDRRLRRFSLPLRRFRSSFAAFQKPRSPRCFRSSFTALQLAIGDASSFCNWRRFIDDTSSVTLHRQHFILCLIGDASSSAVGNASGNALVRDPSIYIFFPFELIFFC